MKIIVVGGGFGGCAAALEAALCGIEVWLLERSDMLGGTGQVGGIMRNNGRFTATEELIAMGGGRLFRFLDNLCPYKNVHFPGHEHASLMDVGKMSASVERFLIKNGVKVRKQTRIVSVEAKEGTRERRLISLTDAAGNCYRGDAFIDATGTAGPHGMCKTYGNGCAMCILRCTSFGGRVSLTGLCQVEEYAGLRTDGQAGAMSGSCKLHIGSLSPEIIRALKEDGKAIIPIPSYLKENHQDIKVCQQYALPEFADHIVLLNTGHAKLMSPYYTLDVLRRIPGFENARYEDPYAGGKGNSIRFTQVAPCDDSLKVKGLENVFAAGEKAGLYVGHTEAIVTGTLAGYNAAGFIYKRAPLVLPDELVCGDAIVWGHEQMQTEQGRKKKYTFSGAVLFERMKSRDMYTTDIEAIRRRVRDAGMADIFMR